MNNAIKSFEARGNDTTIYGTKVSPTSIYGTNVFPEYLISYIPKSVFGYVITVLNDVSWGLRVTHAWRKHVLGRTFRTFCNLFVQRV